MYPSIVIPIYYFRLTYQFILYFLLLDFFIKVQKIIISLFIYIVFLSIFFELISKNKLTSIFYLNMSFVLSIYVLIPVFVSIFLVLITKSIYTLFKIYHKHTNLINMTTKILGTFYMQHFILFYYSSYMC